MGSKQVMKRIGDSLAFMRVHRELTMILFLSFMMSFYLAGWNSYWIDELLSVVTYGIQNESVFDAIKLLGEQSIHPPLYQFILYLWMDIFGHSEVVTRTLSALYITLATLFLYLFVLKIFGKRVAIASILFFSLSYSAVYYSAETRSYAQTIFLVVLSSYCLLKYIEYLQDRDASWKSILYNRAFFWFTIVNFCLIFTHYYNVFFLASQGLFLLIWLLWKTPKSNIVITLLKAGSSYAIIFSAFFVLWGHYFLDRATTRHESFAIDDAPSLSPMSMLYVFVVRFNLLDTVNWFFSLVFYNSVIFLFIFLVIKKSFSSDFIFWQNGKIRLNQNREVPYTQLFFRIYILFWLIFPFVFAYLGFLIISFERVQSRYFTFVVPALMILLALVLEELIKLADILIQKIAKISLWDFYRTHATLFAIVATIILIVPRGQIGATSQRSDWRGITQRLVDVVNHDSDNRYLVYYVGHRQPELLNYYLERYHETLRVHDVVGRAEEIALRSGEDIVPIIIAQENIVSQYDYFVLVFTHDTTINYPNTLDLLSNRHHIHHIQVNSRGHGFIIYSIISGD